MTMSKIIINSSLALSLAASITIALVSLVYAEKQKQLEQALAISDQFHIHQVEQKEIIGTLQSREALVEQRVALMSTTLEEVRKDVKSILEKVR